MATDKDNNGINDKAENILYICFGFFPLVLAVTGLIMILSGVCFNNDKATDEGKNFMITGWGGTGLTLVHKKFIKSQIKDDK